MQKDIALKQLAEHEDVFAEVFNQLAFGGKNIITPGELTEPPTEAIVMEMEGQLREKRRDIVKADLTTDIRLLADYVAYRKDPYKRKNILRDMSYKIRHWKETLTALAAIAGDKRYTQMIKAWEDKIPQEDGEEEHDMCEMLEEIWSEAKEEGIKEGIKEGIGALIKLCKNFQVSRQETLQKILESFSLPQQEAEEYLAMYW